MEINQLRYFLKVYDLLNYSKAANELLISRQALRQSIQSLEKELNSELFINNKNHLYPTTISNIFYEKASKVVDSYNQMEFEIKNLQIENNELKIGLCSSLFPFFTPELESFIEQFEQQFPSIHLTTSVMDMDHLFESLDNKLIDAIITLYMPNPNDNYHINTLTSFKLGVTLNINHPKANEKEIKLNELNGHKATCMGDLKKTMYPLYKKIKDESIDIEFEKIESPIDAFYLMTKNNYCLFNSKWLGNKNFDINSVCCGIEDFNTTWDLDVVSIFPRYEIQLLSDFLKEQYSKMLIIE